MNKCSLILLLTVLASPFISSNPTTKLQCSKKGFTCKDQHTFYQCIKTPSGPYVYVPTKPMSCPPGLMCDDANEHECMENISKEFILADNPPDFNDFEYRKSVIDG